MKHIAIDKLNTADFFNEIFDCKKMKSLVEENGHQSFSEKFRNWLHQHTTHTKERVWVDIESYQAG